MVGSTSSQVLDMPQPQARHKPITNWNWKEAEHRQGDDEDLESAAARVPQLHRAKPDGMIGAAAVKAAPVPLAFNSAAGGGDIPVHYAA